MSRPTVVAFMFVVAISSSLARGEERTSSAAEFKEFGSLVAGRWVVDVTLISDWPGQAKKQGEKITGYSHFKWIADGKGIQWDDVGGTGVSRTLFTFDARTRHIKGFSVGTSMVWQVIIWKINDHEWGWQFTDAGTVDGQELTGEGCWLFKKDGKSLDIVGSVKRDGKDLPKLRDVFTRVAK